MRIPSALTVRGDFYSYLSSNSDEDYFLLSTDHYPQICLSMEDGLGYTLEIYSFADRLVNATGAAGSDGMPDGLIWRDYSAAAKKCFSVNGINPIRTYEFRYIVGVRPNGDVKPLVPYWLKAKG